MIKPVLYKQKNGSFKCNHSKCKCCSNITDGTSEFKSYSTKRTFPIKQQLNCGSTNIIYIISCTCGLQYVGKTSQTLRMCMNSHRYNILNGYSKHSVSRHASVKHNCRIEDFRITTIEQISWQNPCHIGRCSGYIRLTLLYRMVWMSLWIMYCNIYHQFRYILLYFLTNLLYCDTMVICPLVFWSPSPIHHIPCY